MPEENKSNMLAILIVVIVIIVGLALFLLSQNNSSQPNNSNNPISSPRTNKLTFTLTQQNNSGQNGTITLEENGNSTKVSLFFK